MYRFLIFSVALFVSATLAADPNLDDEWRAWKEAHGRVFPAEGGEESYRRSVWETNRDIVVEHNRRYAAGLTSYTMAMNQLADMTSSEVSRKRHGLRMRQTDNEMPNVNAVYNVTGLPTTVDWRTKGYVTPVKDQGDCSSCWSFAVTGALEGQHFKKTGDLISLSEQNLIDCVTNVLYMCDGCDGGILEGGFEFIADNKGIDSEKAYPYEGDVSAKCRFKRSGVAATNSAYVVLPRYDESALQYAVATVGPLAVGIDAESSFTMYSSGIYDEPDCSQTSLDHAVVIVGYGTLNKQDYWLVKNSYGPKWGMNGYIMMSRNKDNQCGIATDASYPIV